MKSLAIGLLVTGCLITGYPAFAGAGNSPALMVQKNCVLDTTAPGGSDGQVNPGDTCTIIINNTGDASTTGLAVDDVLDPNTTFVEGSLTVVPDPNN